MRRGRETHRNDITGIKPTIHWKGKISQVLQVSILAKEGNRWKGLCHSGLESHDRDGFVSKCTQYSILGYHLLKMHFLYMVFCDILTIFNSFIFY